MAKTYKKGDGSKNNSKRAIQEHEERKATKYGAIDFSEVFYESVDESLEKHSICVSKNDGFKAAIRESLDVKLHNRLEALKQTFAKEISPDVK